MGEVPAGSQSAPPPGVSRHIEYAYRHRCPHLITRSVQIGARTVTFLQDRRTHSDVFGARTLTFRIVLSVSLAHAL